MLNVNQSRIFLVAADKDYDHLRNYVWGDMKKRAMEKRDRLARTYSQGEELTQLEKLVLEAIGPESAVVEGLPVPRYDIGYPYPYPYFG